MSLIREVFSGYASRLRLENSLKLRQAQRDRPRTIALEMAKFNTTLQAQLTDPEVRTAYDTALAYLTAPSE